MKSKILLLIPARFQSSRFPGKPLADLEGKSLIQRVWEKARALGQKSKHTVVSSVVTDDERIEKHLLELGASVVRVDDDVISGSERIALAYQRYYKNNQKFDFILNVQGDEPLIAPETLESLIDYHVAAAWDIATLYHSKKLDSEGAIEFRNPNRVKIALSPQTGRCLYFSRAQIPSEASEWYQHIGVYCYRASVLEKFVTLPPSYLEKLERLEQLRALEAGMTIGALETKNFLMGVDTPEDLEKVKGVIRGKITE